MVRLQAVDKLGPGGKDGPVVVNLHPELWRSNTSPGDPLSARSQEPANVGESPIKLASTYTSCKLWLQVSIRTCSAWSTLLIMSN